MTNFLEILILIIPALVFALWNWRNGISHPDFLQVAIVTIIILLCSIGVSTYELATGWPVKMASLKWVHLKCLAVSITGYGLFFPLAFNWMWYLKNKRQIAGLTSIKSTLLYVLNSLSHKAWPDRLFLKYKISWQIRLIMYAVLFLAAILWFTWDSFRSLESYLH